MIEGIGIQSYRSIGERQRISPLGKVNVFVGPNNCGKSNVLRFINQNLVALIHTTRGREGHAIASQPHSDLGLHSAGEIGISLDEDRLRQLWNVKTSYEHIFQKIWQNLTQTSLAWIGPEWPDEALMDSAKTWASSGQWQVIWSVATGRNGGTCDGSWVPQTIGMIRQLVPAAPKVYEIPISRTATSQPTERDASSGMLGGDGAILQLAAMQSPSHTAYEANRTKFSAIERFVQRVTDDASAKITVPHTQDEILVRLRNRPFLPLADLGSGIEQVVLHAIAATHASDAVITFEEPELHLHPVLQRQLISYLVEKTTNQYFIATHSAHIIDLKSVNVFHVRNTSGSTQIDYAGTNAARHRVCHELGYRPSDIVQSNSVVWVEGPSDRIYIRDWIRRLDPSLHEGVHYSIMHYGGKLLSHLTASDTGTTEERTDEQMQQLIELRMLNRNVAVVIDSDRRRADAPIRETKQRLVDEISENGGFHWVTAGREIENYVPTVELQKAVEEVKPGRGDAVKKGKFSKVLPSATDGGSTTVDKVRVARAVTKRDYILDRYDLQEKITALISFIRRANGIASKPDGR